MTRLSKYQFIKRLIVIKQIIYPPKIEIQQAGFFLMYLQNRKQSVIDLNRS